jgi:serine/threonine protein kinase/Tfp pilus assembly protein PilF
MEDASPEMLSIFAGALEQPSFEKRAAFLDTACRASVELRQRIEALLKAHDKAGGFLQDEPQVGNAVATVDEPIAERPGSVLGPYKLMEQIGEGGMGLVFVAEQQHPVRRKVALKVIKPGMDTRQVVARFEAERQALALMDHPNIAKVLDGGETASGRPYFVMELVKGVPITEYCDENQVPVRERLELFRHVCQAVQHAHQKGIIHRDIKPSNVLIMSQDGTPLVKVIDFGVAKAIGQQLTDKSIYTQFSQLVGTPLYMSPEQAGQSGVDVDTRTDIYSLGVLLYELLTGTTPFDRERLKDASYEEIRRIIREEEPPRPSTRISTLGQAATTLSTQRRSDPQRLSHLCRGELDWIVMKALEKDRNRRYETASALAADVQRYLHDEPVLACPPSAWYRVRKFSRRNKTAIAVAGLVLFFLAVLVGGGGWVVRDRVARWEKIDGEVARTLDQGEELTTQGKWSEALVSLEQAEKLVATGGRSECPQRLEDLKTDLAMAVRLEKIYEDSKVAQQESLAIGMPSGISTQSRRNSEYEEDFFWGRLQDAAFDKAFRDFGINIEAMEPAEAAARIKARTIRVALIKALDDWAAERKRARGKDDSGWKKVIEVARLADPDEWRNPCREAVLRGDRQALAKLAGAIPIDRVPPATLWMLGSDLTELGARDEGMSLLRKAQERYPDDPNINEALGWFYRIKFQPPRYEEALRFFSIALALRPRLPRAYRGVAEIFMEKGTVEEAIPPYSRTIDLDPKNPAAWQDRAKAYLKLYQYHEAIADFTKAIELDPKKEWAWRERGWAYHGLGQYDKAIADFNKAIQLNPKLAAAWSYRGIMYKTLHLYDQAIADFNKALGLDPKDLDAWNFRASIYMDLQQWDKALADLNKSIEVEPKFPDAWRMRGLVYRSLHQHDKELANYAKAGELDPKVAAYLNCEAWLLATCADAKLRDAAKAVRLAKNNVQMSPNEATYWNTLGAAHYRMGNWRDAVAALERSIALSKGGDAADFFFLAMAHRQLGNNDEAGRWYEKAMEWMDKNQKQLQQNKVFDEELHQFRGEAAELLGIKEKKSATEHR